MFHVLWGFHSQWLYIKVLVTRNLMPIFILLIPHWRRCAWPLKKNPTLWGLNASVLFEFQVGAGPQNYFFLWFATKRLTFSSFLLSGAGLTDRHYPSVPRPQLLERGDEIEISSSGAEIISFNKLNFQSFIILRRNLKTSPRRCQPESVEVLEL